MSTENTNGYQKKLTVAIVGGGLVGSLCACLMAKRGYSVELYEYRDDIRKMEFVQGRSINLALAARGRAALKLVGLDHEITRNHGIPMGGRMVHNVDGTLKIFPYDARTKKTTFSVCRKHLNETLLTAAEKYSNVSIFFEHKLINADLNKGHLTFLRLKTKETVEVTANLIIGADGAFSTVRRHMMKLPLFDFNQTYIEHGYMELYIPADSDGNFQMPPNYLHIWPRNEFMMIALPNQDHSWTVTIFMPFVKFQSIDTTEKLLEFFQKYFPDSINLIGRDRLIRTYFNATPFPLISIKCKPYHYGNKSVIIGDAAHAMVPFYGQGMNAGFEDCLILDQLIETYGTDLKRVLEEFTANRWKDAHAICDLAVYNYVEMRDLVNRRSFTIRKKVDDVLFWLFPNIWIPLYNSVTFSNMRYHKCIENRKWQDTVIKRCLRAIVAVALAFIVGVSAAYFY